MDVDPLAEVVDDPLGTDVEDRGQDVGKGVVERVVPDAAQGRRVIGVNHRVGRLGDPRREQRTHPDAVDRGLGDGGPPDEGAAGDVVLTERIEVAGDARL